MYIYRILVSVEIYNQVCLFFKTLCVQGRRELLIFIEIIVNEETDGDGNLERGKCVPRCIT